MELIEWGEVIVGILGLFVVALIGGGVIYYIAYSTTYSEDSIVISEKWVDVSGSSGKYLLSSQTGEVFTIKDSLLNGRWDSSNMYARLQPGMTCHIRACGWRFPFLSDYRNILEANCQP